MDNVKLQYQSLAHPLTTLLLSSKKESTPPETWCPDPYLSSHRGNHSPSITSPHMPMCFACSTQAAKLGYTCLTPADPCSPIKFIAFGRPCPFFSIFFLSHFHNLCRNCNKCRAITKQVIRAHYQTSPLLDGNVRSSLLVVVVVVVKDINVRYQQLLCTSRQDSDASSSFSNSIRKHNMSNANANANHARGCDACQKRSLILHLICICLLHTSRRHKRESGSSQSQFELRRNLGSAS
ncbi:hypothetical protein BKA64DRAFT_221588 [Cadophora sp. MPI-SDFR-AT-0126]|nr:hypothetical protein BKA64DRAFT_221588 [Leotiomycetes sp. MPI-SDFR-AT-0126]